MHYCRSNEWICLFVPNTFEIIHGGKVLVPSRTTPGMVDQHDMAVNILRTVCSACARVLVRLSCSLASSVLWLVMRACVSCLLTVVTPCVFFRRCMRIRRSCRKSASRVCTQRIGVCHRCLAVYRCIPKFRTHRTKFYYFCDRSVCEKAWRSRKRVAQAT